MPRNLTCTQDPMEGERSQRRLANTQRQGWLEQPRLR